MSRIDEALKRVSTVPSRSTGRTPEASLRLADEVTIEQYPRESRGERLGPAPTIEAPAPREHRVASAVSDLPRAAVQAALAANSRLVISADRNVVSLEQYRRLAASLHEAQVGRGLKTVMVTSTVPREGKTLTAVNLALTLSASYGRRVLLVDADLRRPSVHEIFGIKNQNGLNQFLRSESTEVPVVHLSSSLSILPSGRVEQNPQAGLSSDRMRELLDDLANDFDWVIVDTPPTGLVSDAHILSRQIQAVVFVIRASSTPFRLIEKAVAEIGREFIIGTVLNAVEEDTLRASGYYGDYYDSDPAPQGSLKNRT